MQYVARQPILNQKQELHAYELLFRDSPENRCPAGDPEMASKRTMDTAVLLGLDEISDGHRVFVNCTHDVVVDGLATLFPARLTTVEILESARPSRQLVEACRKLKQEGYLIALDDFVPQAGYEALVELADVIKIDFRSTTKPVIAEFAAKYRRNDRQLLAEKVETEEEFRYAIDLGYSLFQGYLFSRPNVLSTAGIEGLEANQLRILRLLGNPQLDFVEIEETIKADPALCYRLLRFLNSSAFYFQCEIRSILHGLTLLGEDEMRKWLLLTSAVILLRGKNPHLFNLVLVRSRFAELLGPNVQLPSSALFILGMLSLMDSILQIPKAVIAEQVAIAPEIRAALKGETNGLARCLELVMAFEDADWNRCDRLRKCFHLSAATLSQSYLAALRWAKLVSC